MLFTSAKVAHLGLLPQGQPERDHRVLSMVHQMDLEEFGGCTLFGECEDACPKEISVENIAPSSDSQNPYGTFDIVVTYRTIPLGNGDHAAIGLLVLMTLGTVVAFGFKYGVLIQVASSILLGLGYGLVYSVIQTQAVNDAPTELRNAALTWFVIAYFLGVFGFPVIGGWLIVTLGTGWFLGAVVLFAVAELALAFMRTSRV